MKKILLLIVSFVMISCGSVKKSKYSSTSEGNENIDFKESTGNKSNIQSFENASIKIENNGFNISVKPLNGQNSFFNFTSPDGQLFQGTTNAEISFEKKAEKKEVFITKKTVTKITYWSNVTYKSQITYKTVVKYLDKYKEAYPWYYIFIAGFMLRELLRLLWNWAKKSNWYMNLIERISKKR
ncbi:hypothetical protein [Chryseobacterium sp. ZHDP1]|uniref:hypothetical protein n=1 Tax=Chryseobacterium sp. ZHDP1 TaxID=2838877 RepID=UPI001BDFAB66|nr:hypothetical protein [Chryseobacterium sp. ZHDP1]QWA38880.1 hypothetical protein KKI44_01325 [Chryseobacterium sp. ZHDP1]